MDEIISLVVANGLFAVLFCGLLVYELRDSRNRERRYDRTIRALTDKLDVIKSVKSDAVSIRADVEDLAADVEDLAADVTELRSDVTEIKNASTPRRGKSARTGGCECAQTTA